MINTHFIFKLLELHSLVVAYLLIIDHKMDGKYDLVLVDEDYIKDVKKGLKRILERMRALK